MLMIIFLSLKIKSSKMCEATSLSENFESSLNQISLKKISTTCFYTKYYNAIV